MARSKKSYDEVAQGTKDVIPYSQFLEHLKVNIGHHDVITVLINMFNHRSDFDELVWKSNRKNPKLWLSKGAIAAALIFGYSLLPQQTAHVARQTANAYIPGLVQPDKSDQMTDSSNATTQSKQ